MELQDALQAYPVSIPFVILNIVVWTTTTFVGFKEGVMVELNDS